MYNQNMWFEDPNITDQQYGNLANNKGKTGDEQQYNNAISELKIEQDNLFYEDKSYKWVKQQTQNQNNLLDTSPEFSQIFPLEYHHRQYQKYYQKGFDDAMNLWRNYLSSCPTPDFANYYNMFPPSFQPNTPNHMFLNTQNQNKRSPNLGIRPNKRQSNKLMENANNYKRLINKTDKNTTQNLISKIQIKQKMVKNTKLEVPKRPHIWINQEILRSLAQELQKRKNGQKQLTVKELSLKYSINIKTLYKIKAHWNRDPTLKDLIEKRNKLRGQGRKSLFLKTEATNLVTQNPFLSSQQIADMISQMPQFKAIYKNNVTKKILRRVLKSAGFEHKRIILISQDRNKPENISQRANFCSKLMQFKQKNYTFYFLDEAIYNVYIKKDFAWLPTKKRYQAPFIDLKSNENLSLMAIISSKGMVSWEVNIGKIDRVKIRSTLHKMMYSLTNRPEKRVLILNRYENHNNLYCPEIIKQYQFQVLQMPPFCQWLNPVYLWLSEIKNLLKKQNFKSKSELLNLLMTVINIFQRQQIQDYYLKLDQYIKKALNNQNF